MKGLSTIIYSITSTIAFLAFWYNVNSWYSDDTSLLAIIIAGIAANGAFFGNIILIIIEQNDVYKSKHNNEDMLLVRKFKKIFTSKN
jgi:hypothetical protein